MMRNARYDATHGKGLRVLTLEQMLQRLPIAFEEVKSGNTSKTIINEIRKIISSLYGANEIT